MSLTARLFSFLTPEFHGARGRSSVLQGSTPRSLCWHCSPRYWPNHMFPIGLRHAVVTGFPFYDQVEHEQGLDPDLERFLMLAPPRLSSPWGTVSAVQHPGSFYCESLAAVRRLGCRAILLAGGNSLDEPLPAGTMVFSYAPFSKVFPRASVVVHQGGMGTCGQTMAAGRPMLVVPFALINPTTGPIRTARSWLGPCIVSNYEPICGAMSCSIAARSLLCREGLRPWPSGWRKRMVFEPQPMPSNPDGRDGTPEGFYPMPGPHPTFSRPSTPDSDNLAPP